MEIEAGQEVEPPDVQIPASESTNPQQMTEDYSEHAEEMVTAPMVPVAVEGHEATDSHASMCVLEPPALDHASNTQMAMAEEAPEEMQEASHEAQSEVELHSFTH